MTTAYAFENGTLDASSFRHPDHIKVIWTLIHGYGVLEAIARFETGLRRISAELGHPEKFHATITYAFAFLVDERMVEFQTWEDFESKNTDLFDWPNTPIHTMYSTDQLYSDEARRKFVLPAR